MKRQLLSEVQSICPPGVTIMNVRQANPLGLGHSVLCARPMIGDNPFVVVLPDVLLDDSTADHLRYNLPRWWHASKRPAAAVLAKHMPGEDLSEYGVLTTEQPLDNPGDISTITNFVENLSIRPS